MGPPPQDATLDDADPADRLAARLWPLLAGELAGTPRRHVTWAELDDTGRRVVLTILVALLAALGED